MISHKRLLNPASVFATFLLCWLPAIAQTSSAQAEKPGTISGRVVNESGRPLPNAIITVRRVGAMNPENINATTDREGKFEVNGLPRMSYQIFAFLQGYAPLLRTDLDDTKAGVYRVGDSVTLVLTKGGVITGTVTNQAGEPVVGITVRVLMVHTANTLSYPYNLIGPSDLTDDRGIYRIYGLPEGTYVAWAGGGESRFTPNEDPFASDVPTYAPASTRDTAQEIVVRAGVESNGVDIQYRGESGHTVSGTASGPNSDKSLGFAVNLVSASGVQASVRSGQGPNDRGFMFQGVDDGDYNISALSVRQDGEWMLSAAKQIKVRGADVSGVELVVQPLSSVTGRVILEEIKTTECSDKQRPVFTETVVSAQNASDTLAGIPWPFGTVNADEQGNILLKNLPPGRYYFNSQYFAKDWYLKSLSFVSSETASTKAGKTLDAARTWTTLKPGDRLNGLTITLAQGAASLRGQIALSQGETRAQKLYVYLIPAEREMVDDPLRFYGAAVTADGKIALNNVAPGRYLVFAQEVTDESVSPLTRLRSPDETAYRSRLHRKAVTVNAEIELKSCQKAADLKVRVSL
jgi:hypothetical protein